MKKISTFLISILFTLSVFGQTETEVIKKANDFIANKKYESAYNILDNFDPNNGSPNIVLLKEDIALNYFVSSIMHQSFGFVDLEKGQNISDFRGKEGSFGMKMFVINKVLDSLITIYPNNCKLYKGLGDYYYQVQIKYSGRWLKEDSVLFELMDKNFSKAIEGNCGDYMSYFVKGYISVVKEKYKDCIPYFMKSLTLNKDFSSSYYNIAYSYLNLENRDSVLKYAKNSFDIDSVAVFKSDAARMMGQVYSDMLNGEKAIFYYELADKIDSGNYYNIKPLLNLYMRTGSAKVKETTMKFFNLEPTNPTIFNDLEEIYYNNKKEKDLIAFYKEQLPAFKDNLNVTGNLYFFLGKIYIATDKKLAKEYLINAKTIFKDVYDKDHPVFKAIEDGLNEIEKAEKATKD